MNSPLPADVRAALAAGDKIEAIRRLRRHHVDMSLADAKAAIETTMPPVDGAPLAQGWELPAEVRSALDKGSLIQAIRALRSNGVGLKQAKALVDTARRAPERPASGGPSGRHPAGLAPGEVPRSPIGAGTVIIVMLVLALLIWQFLQTDWR